jgi:uncharacterized protein (DUF58 family)
MKELLNRVIAALLITLAVTAGIWFARPPLAAAPATVIPEPGGAPLPIPAPIPVAPAGRRTTLTTIEVPVEVEIATGPPAVQAAEKPSETKPSETKPKPQTNCRPSRRGWFRRR